MKTGSAMIKSLLLTTVFCVAMPFQAGGALDSDSLPSDTVWYVHVDLDRMRSSDAGREIYAWLEDEIIEEIREEVGVDLNEEVDRITAFSNDGEGYVAIVEGRVSEEAQNSVLRMTEVEDALTELEHRGQTYFYGSDDSARSSRRGRHEDLPGYFTFAIDGKMIASSSEDTLKAMMDNGGRIVGAGAHKDAIFVLSADKQFAQAGMRTKAFADEDDDWESNILRSTEQAAMLVSDKDGKIAVEAKLVATDAELTQSISSIIGGLIALQAFNSDLDPALADVLLNTKVDADDNVLTISTVLDPATVVQTLDD